MKKPQIILGLIIALTIWLIAVAGLTFFGLFRQLSYDFPELLFYAILFLPPALIFSFLLVFVLNQKTSAGAKIGAALVAVMLLWGAVILLRGEMTTRKFNAQETCRSNLRTLSLAILMYADDWDGRLPLAGSWAEAVFDYTKTRRVYQCPADFSEARSSYAFNANLSGLELDKIDYPDKVVLLYETNTPGANPSGQGNLALRHRGTANIAFIDAQVKQYDPTKSPPLEWEISP